MTAAGRYIADTNILLRFFLGDHAEHSPIAREVIAAAQAGKIGIEVPLIAIFETVFSLGRFYKQRPSEVAGELLKLLRTPGITQIGPNWVVDALEAFGDGVISFGDVCIAAEARRRKQSVLSFDSDFEALPDVARVDPKILVESLER